MTHMPAIAHAMSIVLILAMASPDAPAPLSKDPA
jgi:hypothetical protein